MPNLLATEPSAYLKSAAHQPVHWHPWGDAAFTRARTEDKPILLDIGAVWCHWCHVMDGESYEDARVADLLNADFVCIKVDRDERPDVDTRYQRAVQALTGQGGWPLTAFLTPEGEVFFGGTYFPPEENHYGRPGFPSVLRQVAGIYRQQRDKVAENAKAIRHHVAQSLDEAQGGDVSATTLERAAAEMARLFDIRYGGFGTAPKFPHPAATQFLLARWHDTGEHWVRDVVEKTLTGMAKGGIRDHVGGGFHRYAVDERWIVPHFEKMAYDNSELLHAYLDAYAALGTPLFKRVARETVDWVLEVLSDRERGAFFTSQDADVRFGDDGDYWTWTLDEVRDALTDDKSYHVIRRVYDVETEGEMHHNPRKNVLWWKRDPAGDDEWPLLEDALTRLKAARDRRTAPFVDTTPYVNWNAMMASAFLHAGAVLDRPECNALALKVLERIWSEAWDEGRGMGHVIGGPSRGACSTTTCTRRPRSSICTNPPATRPGSPARSRCCSTAAGRTGTRPKEASSTWRATAPAPRISRRPPSRCRTRRRHRGTGWPRCCWHASRRSPTTRNGAACSPASSPHSGAPRPSWRCTGRPYFAPSIGPSIPPRGSRCTGRAAPGGGRRAICICSRSRRIARGNSWFERRRSGPPRRCAWARRAPCR